MEGILGLWPFLAMFVVMWFLLIRPAQKRQKQTKTMQESLKRGDEIVTIGGIHGKIDAVDESTVYVTVAEGTILRLQKQAIGSVTSV